MPRACSVCTHAERDAIDRALIEAAPMRRIAAQHALAETSVRRHAERHLPATLVLAAEAGEGMRADSLLERARWAHAQAVDVLEQAREANSPAGMLQALDRVGRLLVIEGAFLAQEGPTDRELTISWEAAEAAPCARCGHSGA
jgi:predicted metal-dependent HD superfamily phosphohydrolase